ncbi:DUF2306 domain-containing protein [Alicyclobacillus dauci]|uniref:DUF2306 domain-containing protein n=1 Tax=Alicyclobacillus dauci TaxID=1475485 RepID=A0ABY6Z9D7_9BACL|nr:DUF2306 domain-containing protein [Alicyclobacillus dauci]WAH38786.1 DUF2306 domain-containing protein [Alicyclobacillus dauci]
MSLFSGLIIVHIVSGTCCLVMGAVALLARKRRGKHTVWGEAYHATYVILFLSALFTSILHWQQDAYLFYIDLFSYGLALLGYLSRKIRWKDWLKTHIAGMAGSYIALITAIFVVNQPHIPGMNKIPALVFWFLPTIVGTPLIFRTASRYTKPRKLTKTNVSS